MSNQLTSLLARSRLLQRARRLIDGNSRGMYRVRSKENRVNLEYCHINNLGDALTPVIVEWMLAKEGLSLDSPAPSTKHLFAVGSNLGRGIFDATVWGAGILSSSTLSIVKKQRGIRELDIRAVRGPNTRDALISAGYSCPDVYGDPALLLPLIYSPEQPTGKSGKTGVILHHATHLNPAAFPENMGVLDIKTDDYCSFVNELVQYDKIISTSLHGIILAESYGVPCVYLWENSAVGMQGFKFEDWYLSTGRSGIMPARSIEEALAAEAPALPELDDLREKLMDVFPYDLWG